MADVKGMALSRERFQFIFKHEHDLLDVLNRGVHTLSMWHTVMERRVKTDEEHLDQSLYPQSSISFGGILKTSGVSCLLPRKGSYQRLCKGVCEI